MQRLRRRRSRPAGPFLVMAGFSGYECNRGVFRTHDAILVFLFFAPSRCSRYCFSADSSNCDRNSAEAVVLYRRMSSIS